MKYSYIHDSFPEEHVPTVLDCYRTEVQIDGRPLTLQIWDSAGQDDYSRLRPLGYADADVFLLCYSVADRDSYKNVDLKVSIPIFQLIVFSGFPS